MKQQKPPDWKKTYKTQLQGCNAMHVISGLISIALACTQFTDIGLENYNYIDFRLLNWTHLVTGSVGIFMVLNNYGSIAAKALYCMSAVLGLFTVHFYAFTLRLVVKNYKELEGYSRLQGGADAGYDSQKNFAIGKIVVCVIMIFIGLTEFVLGVFSERILEKLASDAPNPIRSHQELKNRGRLAFVAVMKIFFSLATIALGDYLDLSLHFQKDTYLRIAWQELAGGIVFCSGVVDLMALYGSKHNLLNMKVSLVLSVVSAVLSLKTLDYIMSGFFLKDVSAYTNFQDPSAVTESPFGGLLPVFTTQDPLIRAEEARQEKRQLFTKFAIHAGLIGCLVLLFVHSIIAAVESGAFMERKTAAAAADASPGLSSTVVDRNLNRQRNCLGIFQFTWGVCLIALCIISLVPWEFSEGYSNGPAILWVGCLFVASGSVTSGRIRTLTTSVYVFAVISSVVSLEYLLFSINEICQAVTHEKFANEPEQRHLGRIVLFSVQAAVLLLEFLTATPAAFHFEKVINELPSPNAGYVKSRKQCLLASFHFVYAALTIGVNILSEVGIWKYNANPINNSFVKLTNGPIALVTGVVQIISSRNPKFLLPAAMMEVVTGSITFFVLAPATTSLYSLVTLYRSQYDPARRDLSRLSDNESNQKLFAEVAIGITSAVILVAMIEYIISIASALHNSFLMHHRHSGVRSDGGRFSTVGRDPHHYHHRSMADLAGSAYHLNGLNGHSSVYNLNGKTYGHTNGHGALHNGMNGNHQQRYFGNDYRIYSGGMYNPESVLLANGQGASTYGYVVAGDQRMNNYAQTNIRHVFQNVHNGYLAAYS